MLRNIKLMSLLIMAITIASCDDDFLDTTPTDAIAAPEALANETNMQLVLNGLHRGLYSQSQEIFPGGNTARANNHFWIPMGDALSGGLIHSANANNLNWRDLMQWNEHTLQTSLTTEILWYHRYNIIAGANLLINRATDGTFLETPELFEILGQAYTYRAYGYLSLVQHFAKGYLIGSPATDPGVPLLLSSELPFTSAARSTVQEIYDLIEADLNAAIIAFEEGTGRPSGGSGGEIPIDYRCCLRTFGKNGVIEWGLADCCGCCGISASRLSAHERSGLEVRL